MTKDQEANRTIECDKHGARTSAIVCCHLLRATGLVLGFVEDGDPDDPLAWCNECETRYAREKEWNEAFKRFADLKVVCDACYAQLKEQHSERAPSAN